MAERLRWKEVKTRKPHRCWGCAKIYPAETEMVSASYVDDGTLYSCYWCETCEEYMRRYFESGDDVEYGGIFENDHEGWEALKNELEAERKGKGNG